MALLILLFCFFRRINMNNHLVYIFKIIDQAFFDRFGHAMPLRYGPQGIDDNVNFYLVTSP